MGGEQAASVLSTLKRDQIEQKGAQWSAQEEDEFKQPLVNNMNVKDIHIMLLPAFGMTVSLTQRKLVRYLV